MRYVILSDVFNKDVIIKDVIKTLLFILRMSYFKWMHISKKWFSRFFLCSGMKLEFLLLTGIK